MSKAARVPDYLAHILKAIERIERYTEDMSAKITAASATLSRNRERAGTVCGPIIVLKFSP